MIKTDNLNEFQTLLTLKMYCKSHENCDNCLIKLHCEYWSIPPAKFNIEYESKEIVAPLAEIGIIEEE